MRFEIDAEEPVFRATVRQFIEDNLPDDIRRHVRTRRPVPREMWTRWQRILNARGWGMPSWPVEHGGTGWTAQQRYMFHDELQKAPAPEPHTLNGMIGPILIAFGSQAQKSTFLPRLSNLDDLWCQGFSEPNAGSDLADLRTTAVPIGDSYIVNGQKTWISSAHEADWMFCLVRTRQDCERKRDGISMLLIDMRTPGVSVRPIDLIDGSHEVSEVFLNDVEVSRQNLVGEENRGWHYAKHLLAHERAGIARVGVSLERLGYLDDVVCPPHELALDASLQHRRGEIAAELRVLEITQRRALQPDSFGQARQGVASILKLKGSELHQRTVELLADAAGVRALRTGRAPHAPRRGNPDAELLPAYWFSRSYSIYGGSTQIQKNILAAQVLGLSS